MRSLWKSRLKALAIWDFLSRVTLRGIKCRICRNLDLRDIKNKDGLPEIECLVLDISSSKCRYCTLLHNLIQSFEPDIMKIDQKAFLEISHEKNGYLDVEILTPEASIKVGRSFFLYNTSGSHIADFPAMDLLGVTARWSDSEACYNFIKNSIRECHDSHEECSRAVSAVMPLRILDIGLKNEDLVRLVESSAHCSRYITLSHCWGGQQPLRTVVENIDQLKDEIPWSDLSNVFQDAICVSRKLGIQYLWIDSLCIVQNSITDWETESSKMGSYYENAFLTISASSSPNGQISFLKERNAFWHPRILHFESHDGTTTQLYARRHNGHQFDYTGNIPAGDGKSFTETLPLDSRAWTWQENFLSLRVLHYRESELVWECRSLYESEDGTQPRLDADFHNLCGSYAITNEFANFEWLHVIESYSERKLTYESDKLPSLSGAAERFQNVTKSNYFAGLWLENMPVELCWHKDCWSANSNLDFAPAEYIAPSWSWASANGVIDFEPETSWKSHITIQDVHCTVPGKNKFGQVSDGYLILSGSVISVTLKCIAPDDPYEYKVAPNQMPAVEVMMKPDCFLVECEVAGNQQLRRAKPGEFIAGFAVKDLMCIYISRCTKFNTTGKIDIGLILAQTESEEETYTRIGLVKLDQKFKRHRNWFKDATKRTIKII